MGSRPSQIVNTSPIRESRPSWDADANLNKFSSVAGIFAIWGGEEAIYSSYFRNRAKLRNRPPPTPVSITIENSPAQSVPVTLARIPVPIILILVVRHPPWAPRAHSFEYPRRSLPMLYWSRYLLLVFGPALLALSVRPFPLLINFDKHHTWLNMELTPPELNHPPPPTHHQIRRLREITPNRRPSRSLLPSFWVILDGRVHFCEY